MRKKPKKPPTDQTKKQTKNPNPKLLLITFRNHFPAGLGIHRWRNFHISPQKNPRILQTELTDRYIHHQYCRYQPGGNRACDSSWSQELSLNALDRDPAIPTQCRSVLHLPASPRHMHGDSWSCHNPEPAHPELNETFLRWFHHPKFLGDEFLPMFPSPWEQSDVSKCPWGIKDHCCSPAKHSWMENLQLLGL